MVVSAGAYLASGGADWMSATPPTIGGNTMTLRRDDDNDGTRLLQCIFSYTSPPTGSQTFAWDWAGASPATLGAQFKIAFYKGINTSSPIGASGGAADTDTSATTGSLTATNGDAIFAAAIAYNAVLPTVDWTNATEMVDTSSLGIRGSAAEAFPSGSVTITATHNGGAGGTPAVTISAVVINQAAGAAGQPTMRRWGAIPGMRLGSRKGI